MDICKCGGRTKVFQENNIKGVECRECGRRFFYSKEDRKQAKEVENV